MGDDGYAMTDRTDKLKGAFACALERQVEELFAHATPVSRVEAEIPVIGGCFYQSWPHTSLVQLVVDELIARERFRTDWPDWPQLPLHKNDCARMTGSGDNHDKLLGFFGASLRESEYDCNLHPPFDAYCSGVLCYEYAPRKLRSDAELRKEFPPRPLEGLCGGWMEWRSPKTIAEHRRVRLKPPIKTPRLELAWSAPLDR